MNQQSKDLGIRPLGIGELADRSVTLLVKNAVPFALVWLACSIPGMLVSAWGASEFSAGLMFFGKIVAGLGSSVAILATAALVGKIYAGEEPRAGWALGRGAAKIPGAIMLGIMLILVAIIPCGALWLITAGIFASLVASSPAIALAAAAIPAIALLVAGALVYFMQYLALNAMAIDDRAAPEALGKAFSYIFHEGRFWPNLALAVCLTVLVYGGAFASGLAGGFLMLKVNLSFGEAVAAVLAAVVGAIGATTAAVFYFDMRMRYDGHDLEQSLDALEQPATT